VDSLATDLRDAFAKYCKVLSETIEVTFHPLLPS